MDPDSDIEITVRRKGNEEAREKLYRVAEINNVGATAK
jgi:hypothetical protein